MSVVLTAMILMFILSLAVMGVVALPQMREGKTVFSQTGLESMDAARRRAAAMARLGGDGADSVKFGPEAPKGRLRSPIGWTVPQAAPRHAR